MTLRLALPVFAVVLLGAAPALSQTTAGQITGIITDPTGAVAAGASVLATNAATGVTRETTSNELGNYTVPLLEPGVYTLTVKKTGFRPIERSGLTLHVNQTARIDFVMELGALTETRLSPPTCPCCNPLSPRLRRSSITGRSSSCP